MKHLIHIKLLAVAITILTLIAVGIHAFASGPPPESWYNDNPATCPFPYTGTPPACNFWYTPDTDS